MNHERWVSADEYQNVVRELWLLNEAILRHEIDAGVSMREPLSSRLAAADMCIIKALSKLKVMGISIEPLLESVTGELGHAK